MGVPLWKPGPLGLLLASGAALLLVIFLSAGSTPGEAPFTHQPIDFFHRVHAGDRKIACGFCHRTAESADFAGMPSTQLCMGCHRVVIPSSPEIWKVRGYWELGQPIPWKRVYQLPAHVYFSHEAHLAGGKMDCTPCHGRVETMDRVLKKAPLTMGWCLDCHRKQKASTECWSCHR
ncbi:MAG TPA: cytochrome c3 family protein [Armatimonadota bacterium]|nr:cytochrome c3 family protein [Armatimonadota bacterium]